MPAQLVAKEEGPTIPLDKPIIIVGRQQECDVQIASRKISRKHCCIAQVNDHLVVRDLLSTNGIRINGVKVIEGRLVEGDELMIGNLAFQVCMNQAAPEAAAQPANGKNPRTALAGDALQSSDQPMPLPEPPRSGEDSPLVGYPLEQAAPDPSLLPGDIKLVDDEQ